jgi:hypothetical protein
MKYAVFFISLFIIFSLEARTITSFNQSSAILMIANSLSENSEDLKTSFIISDKKIKLNPEAKCEAVDANNALIAFKFAMDNVLKMFPDEEIPYEEALNDMKDYLDNQPLTLCKILHKNSKHKILTLYYFDRSDKIHLKIDNRNLL